MLSDNLDKFFNQRATIYRLVTVKDKFGGTKNEWEKMEWNVPCRLYGYVGIMMVDVQGKTYTVTMQLMIKADISIGIGNKIEVGSDKYIAVRVIPRYTMEIAHHQTVLLGRQDE